MPRLFHKPPKYGLHKGTKQAIVCRNGKIICLGPYGSPRTELGCSQMSQHVEHA